MEFHYFHGNPISRLLQIFGIPKVDFVDSPFSTFLIYRRCYPLGKEL